MAEQSKLETQVFAARTKDKDVLHKSSSGGMFVTLSDYVLESGGAVACCVYRYEINQTEYILATSPEERDQAIGSKYMASNPGNIFSKALTWIKERPDKKLLFIGLGCQARAFQNFVEINGVADNVFVVDIICHGSVSPKIWGDYADMLESKHNGCITEIAFRDKRNGWEHPTAFAKINGEEIPIREYMKIFYSRCALRPSCHACPYATTERNTDLTIGDFWGIDKALPDFYNPTGNSLVLIHTPKGKEFFDSIRENVEYAQCDLNKCLQPALISPTQPSRRRAAFWRDYKKGITFVVRKYKVRSLLVAMAVRGNKALKNLLKR